MPNVRAANKVKIGAWVDRMDAANLRQFAASQGLHVSTLIEAAVMKSLPMLFAEAIRGLPQEHGQFTAASK